MSSFTGGKLSFKGSSPGGVQKKKKKSKANQESTQPQVIFDSTVDSFKEASGYGRSYEFSVWRRARQRALCSRLSQKVWIGEQSQRRSSMSKQLRRRPSA